MARRRLVTLLTDFGTADAYVAAMKGVLLSLCRDAEIVDLSHEIPPQDLLRASLVLAEAAPYYPPDTLHVVVVDPGVGSSRRILAGRFGRQRYLFPDNGVITSVAERYPLSEMAVLPAPTGGRAAGISATFHGRDLFAPTAAEMLNGRPIGAFGPAPQSYKLLEIPRPIEQPGAVAGEVIYVDRFGNLVSNLRVEMLEELWGPALHRLSVRAGETDLGPIRRTYAEAAPGELLALVNSMGLVEAAANQASAAEVLNAGIGLGLLVRHESSRPGSA